VFVAGQPASISRMWRRSNAEPVSINGRESTRRPSKKTASKFMT
jgi:hypothetical protein